MAGPTDVLTEDVKDLRESNRRLADEIKDVFGRLSADLRDSSQRLTDALSGLTRDFGNFRVEVAKELGAINTNLEGFRGRTETSFKVAAWGAVLAVTSLLGVVGLVGSAIWQAAHVDATVTALREHAKEQDARIAELIKLHSVRETGLRGPVPVPPPDDSPGNSNVRPPSLEPDPNRKVPEPEKKHSGGGR